MQNLEQKKSQFGEIYGAKSECWALIIFSVRDLQLSVSSILLEICSKPYLSKNRNFLLRLLFNPYYW